MTIYLCPHCNSEITIDSPWDVVDPVICENCGRESFLKYSEVALDDGDEAYTFELVIIQD